MFLFLKKTFFALILAVGTASAMLSLTAMQQDQNIEITLCEHADPQDCLKIYLGLESYNTEKMGPRDEFVLALPDHCPGKGLGSVVRTKGYICEIDIIVQSNDPADLYDTIQAEFKKKGAQTIEINCSEEQSDVKAFLEKIGFTLDGETIDLDTGKKLFFFVKKINDKNRSVNDLHNSLNTDWFKLNDEGCTINLNSFEGCFGVFIRHTDTKNLLGGLFGTLHRDAAIPHCSINYFWIDPAVRGTGLGKQVIAQAENFAREQGFLIMDLSTNEHQAPWFYKKMGYQEVLHRRGNYDFQKSL